MRGFINTSNYYLSTTANIIDQDSTNGKFEIADISVEGVTLPLKGYYWVDVDFVDADVREIFRIYKREGYVLFYDRRISPNGKHQHPAGTSVGLRDFSELFNMLGANADNFGYVEDVDGEHIRVFGGKTNISGLGYTDIEDAIFDIPFNSTKYVEFDIDSNEFKLVDELNELNFSIAKIVSLGEGISTIEDCRATMVSGGVDNMKKAVYDPNNIEADAFNMDNMEQGEYKRYITPEEKFDWDNKQDELVSGVNIKTINGKSLMGTGDVAINTILTVDWFKEETLQGVAYHTLQHEPYSQDSIMVIYDSGTVAIKGVDYTYDHASKTITFTPPLNQNEKAYIQVMVQTSERQEQVIGDGKVTIKVNNRTAGMFTTNQTDDKMINIPVGDGKIKFVRDGIEIARFSANQFEDSEVEVGGDVGKGVLTIKEGGVNKVQFSANDTEDKTVSLSGDIYITQEEFDDLPDSKYTDGNNYIIYSEVL